VIAIDTNLLVYAHRDEMPFHTQAACCLSELAQGRGAWAIPWPCLHEFFGVVTNERIFKTPSTPAQAIAQIDAWHESPSLVVLHESTQHWLTLRRLVTAGKVRGSMIHDARIAAICVDHDAREFWTADRDFNRFPQLTVRNPLIA
jgi:toxin-antitoxin system PIN domain toxin